MINPFEIGDIVILVNAWECHTLELFNSYEVIKIGGDKIALKGTEDENGVYHFWNSKRFIKDIKFLRRKKLQKLLNETN